MRKLLFFAVLTLLLLAGCSRTKLPTQSPSRLVTGITVMYENDPIRFFRRYTSDEKMQQVLNYLRLIDPKGIVQDDPETLPGGQYTITLLYSDGSSNIYRQKSDAYMQTDDGPWKRIDPKKAEWLGQLLEQLESDFH